MPTTPHLSLDPLPLRVDNPLSLPTHVPGHRLPEDTIRAAGLTPAFVYVAPTAPYHFLLVEGYCAVWEVDGFRWPLPTASCWGDRGAYVSIVHLIDGGLWTPGEGWRYTFADRSCLASRIGVELAEVVELVNLDGPTPPFP